MSLTEVESQPVGNFGLQSSLDSFPTHNVSHVGAHVPDINTVSRLLQSLVDDDWKSRGQGRYSNVYVLLISWVDDDLGVIRELQDLETVFTSSFNYDVETWGIPRDKSQRRLQERVTQFVNNYEGNDILLILYYAGHAIRTIGGPVWTARQNPDPKISAESIPVQALLAECDSDALLLYDCCFATPIPASGNTCGVTEAIAACGFHETAPGVGQNSFTNALVNELGILSHSTTPISVGELYRRLVQRLRNDTLNVIFDEDGDIRLGLDGKPLFEGERRRTPIFYPISNEPKRRQILLASLPSKESGSATPLTSLEVTKETSPKTGSSRSEEDANTRSNSGGGPNSQDTRLYPMVLLSIRVDRENLETQTWREWIRDVPPEATNITIQGIYRSLSTLLLLTMPVEMWTLLPDNAAFSFVGFVTSSNLAPKLLSAANSTSPAEERSAAAPMENLLKSSPKFVTLESFASRKRDLGELNEAEMYQKRVLEDSQKVDDKQELKLENKSMLGGHIPDDSTRPLSHVIMQGGDDGNALLAASAAGHKQTVKTLLDKGINVNYRGELFYSSPLQEAAAGGHEQIVKLLLENGADINVQGQPHSSALQAAAARGHEQIVKLLLEKSADIINAKGPLDGTALQAASSRGHEQIVQLLLDKGANVNAKDSPDGTALQAASAAGHEQIVQLLLDKGADINAQGGRYGTALQAASRGHTQIVKLLLDKGADINVQGGLYGTALYAASNRGNKQIVQLLLDKGADINAQGGLHGTALGEASARGHEEIVELLLDKGAEVNAKVRYQDTALQVASARGHKRIVELLLDYGADIKQLDSAAPASKRFRSKK